MKNIFKRSYENYGLTEVFTLLKIYRFELKLIHHKTPEENDYPFHYEREGIQFIMKGGYIKETYPPRSYQEFFTCHCTLPSSSDIKHNKEQSVSIGNIVFLFPEEIIRQKRIKMNTWILQLNFGKCQKHISKRFYINREKNVREILPDNT